MLLHGLRSTLRRQVRRRRRLLAGVLAATAVVLGLASLDRPASSVDPTAADDPSARTALAPGRVAVPLELASSSIAQTLAVGDIVDVVGLSGAEHATASVVAADARVIDLPGAAGFGSASSSVVVVAVDDSVALDVSTAVANGGVSVLIRERAPR